MKDDIFERRRARALALMADKQIWASSTAPPLHRLLWKMNINLPPPPFSDFWLNLLVFSSMYILLIPLLLFLPTFSLPTLDAASIETNLLAGLFFGLAMAGFYSWCRWFHRLPEWQQL